MEDLFANRLIRPMLIGEEREAFDSPDYLFELKLDGERCIAYLDPMTGTELRNKRGVRMLPKVPELAELHKLVRKRCILDGELAVMKDGRTDFFEIQRRSLMSNPRKIELAARKYPACFTAFDLLYEEDHPTMKQPLMERKKLLQTAVLEENERFAVSRWIEQQGKAFYTLAAEQNLEGIVAKKKDSLYYPEKRTREWIKCKNLQDDDFVVCGYILKEDHWASLVIGQYNEGSLVYKGHVTLGVRGENFRKIKSLPERNTPPFPVPSGNENAVWVEPWQVCKVAYMEKTSSGGLRHPILKGLRQDKKPEECIEDR